jgi:uncharacterized cupredoxin-like copper-binding protein
MKFRWWYVSMGATGALILGSMMYLGTFLCLPVEQDSCVSLFNAEPTIPAAPTPPVPPPIPPLDGGGIGVPPPPPPIPAGTGKTAAPNGKKIDFTLSFQVSSDFSKYGFNATIGSQTANPDIKVHSGDTVTFHLTNPSHSFHAFGIVINPDDPNSIVWNSAYKTADSPMKPGESGDVTFVAGTTGLYHYICTVPGHAALGMDGNFIVE